MAPAPSGRRLSRLAERQFKYLAIAPAVGHARVVGVAPHLGLALGYDFDGEEQT